jgi:hypothetical protein
MERLQVIREAKPGDTVVVPVRIIRKKTGPVPSDEQQKKPGFMTRSATDDDKDEPCIVVVCYDDEMTDDEILTGVAHRLGSEPSFV